MQQHQYKAWDEEEGVKGRNRMGGKLCSHLPCRGMAPGLGPPARAPRVRAQSSGACFRVWRDSQESPLFLEEFEGQGT